jgi:hypothetical protein
VLVSIIVFLAFVAAFTLLFRYTTRTVGQRVGEWVDRRHRAAEEILDSGRAPRAWIEMLSRRFPGLASGAVASRRERALKRRLVRELRRLEKYFERSPLVDSEETRTTLVAELRAVREKWLSTPVAELIAPGERSAS